MTRLASVPSTLVTPARKLRTGFTLIDLLLAISILAIVAALALPRLGPDDGVKLVSAATILASDLEFAQSEALADPSNPVLVSVDADAGHYWISRAEDPATPMDRPSGGERATGAEPYEVVFGSGDYDFLTNVQIEIDGVGDGEVRFDSFGRLQQPSDARIRLFNDSGELFVVVSASTGSVSVVK